MGEQAGKAAGGASGGQWQATSWYCLAHAYVGWASACLCRAGWCGHVHTVGEQVDEVAGGASGGQRQAMSSGWCMPMQVRLASHAGMHIPHVQLA